MNNWSLQTLATDLIGHTAETDPTPRDYIWASELGSPMIDRYLRMKGVPYSNPVDNKGLFTFFLGKEIENGLASMLTMSGVAYEGQDKIVVQTPGCLDVSGRPDFILEVDDWQKPIDTVQDQITALIDKGAEEREINKKKALLDIVAGWIDRYPEGLPKTVFEVKSLNSWAFKYNKDRGGLGNAYPHHKLQLYTYMKGLGLSEGHIIYIARDTGRMEEVIVLDNPQLEEDWHKDVETISRYYLNDTQPPREPLKDEKGKTNWRVNYSRYKNMLYPEIA